MSSSTCARCNKTVYPVEGLRCLDKIWHKGCFKCHECNMTLNMKNYKGFEKRPYCNAHCPQAKATTVADTPEIRRLAENTRIQSQAKYHEDFEKSKGKNFTTIVDDPEMRRVKETSKIISNVSYHGEIERKKQMEERRGLSGSDDLPLARANSGNTIISSNNNSSSNGTSPKSNRNSQNLTADDGAMQTSMLHHSLPKNQHQAAQQQYQQQQFFQQQQQKQQLLKHQQYLAQQQQQHAQNIATRQSIHLEQPITRQQAGQQQHQYSQQHQLAMQHQQQMLMQQKQPVNLPIMSRQPSKQAILAQTNQLHHNPLSPQLVPHSVLNNNNNNLLVPTQTSPIKQSLVANQHILPQQLAQMGPIINGPPPQGAQLINILPNGQRIIQAAPGQQIAFNSNHHHLHMPNGPMPKQHVGAQQDAPLSNQILARQHQAMQQAQPHQHQQAQMRPLSGAGPMAAPLQQIAPQQQKVARRMFRAMYDYVANDVDEVSFYENDLLVDCVNVDRNWLIGKVARSGQTGMLPANYVTELPSR